jgi:hypothetical protein
MVGAIAGDIIGSVLNFVVRRLRTSISFITNPGFTDDTVLAVAVAD